MAKQKLMKSGLDRGAIRRMSEVLVSLDSGIDGEQFQSQARAGLRRLELKQRVQHLITVLHEHLPADFAAAAALLKDLEQHWPAGNPADPLRSFAAWPFIDYVAEYGLDHPEIALPLLRRLTSLFSAEFAIRPFIIQHHKISMRHLQAWTGDPNAAVRRLVSEGTRPRLPWGQRLPAFCKDPSPVLALLEQLNDDVSQTVRRSVANNLNDISKDNPDRVILTCRRWTINASPERLWVIRHATRSLVKDGHPAVFGLLGYTEEPAVKVENLKINKKRIRLGESLEFSTELVSGSRQKQKIVIDYAVHHVKANGSTKAKVFKLSSRTLAPGESISFTKSHAIRPISTRKYYSGTHAIEVLVNGKALGQVEFELQI
jgi:3-methyladenine DNA glycosylase AlkC